MKSLINYTYAHIFRSSVKLELRSEYILGYSVNRIPKRHPKKKKLLTSFFNELYMKLYRSGLG